MSMKSKCFLDTHIKSDCVGCEACLQVCAKSAIRLYEDDEGFRYPTIDLSKCVDCGLCRKVCPINNLPFRYSDDKIAFGGYHKNKYIKQESTSGGAFSAIVESWCDANYVIFGAYTDGLKVRHGYITNKKDIGKFRKSKYSQSYIGLSYQEAKGFLKDGKKVLFSGTPCQIAGLRVYLGKIDTSNLLTIEVICEGVPSPLYVRKMSEHFEKKYGFPIESIDYRYKDKNRWDFQVMLVNLTSKSQQNGTFRCDRWFNPFWSIWLNHLMSRPSCYECRFTNISRVADISLGDLWGVHLYCPELYGKNEGASLIVCNTPKGIKALERAKQLLYGHELDFKDALRFQSPMRKSIDANEHREEFMRDLESNKAYEQIIAKWAKKPSLRLLYQKYIWGNRQKIFCWSIKQNIKNLFIK